MIRVLHCPWNIGGNPGTLSAAEREIGIDSRAVTLSGDPFRYPVDEVLFAPTDSVVARERKRLALLRRALTQTDIIHYNFGEQIFPAPENDGTRKRPALAMVHAYYAAGWRAELPLARRLGKGIVVTYQGDDARQKDFCLKRFGLTHVSEVDDSYYPPGSDERKRAHIAHFAKYANRIFALNPDLLHVLPSGARFLPYTSADPRSWAPRYPARARGEALRVVHAPTNRAVKGTRFLVEAVDRLRSEGAEIELVLVEGLPREEARKVYETAHVLVDQLLIGWYGGLAVEAMALGKPVIAYVREEDLVFIPAAMREQLPLVQATPPTIYDVLKQFTGAVDLADIGRRSREYMERWHDPRKIAASMKAEYEAILENRS